MKFSIFPKVFFLLLSSNLAWAQSPLQNHPSEYLAMHAKDPVKWHLWNPKTLAKAKQQNKLLLVSSGYFSCHWCHVAQKELYQDPSLAKRLNQRFINIKVDRELTPDIDRQMINFAKIAIGSAGWPQHVIYTPNGQPFAGFTYLPKDDLHRYLDTLEQTWNTNRAQIKALANNFQQRLSAPKTQDATAIGATQILQSIAEHLDDLSGGIQGTHKFPNSPLLISLLTQHHSPAGQKLDNNLLDWLKFTLEQMQTQHLHDHVYGGFYRYTVDPEWQTPHFEKMLYDNAQLLEVYSIAAQIWPNSKFTQTAEATLRYLRSHLFDPKLTLYRGSQSALNQQGQEGGDYLWSHAQLTQQLDSAQMTQITKEWQLDNAPPYSLGWHPRPTTSNWNEIRAKLQQRATHQAIPTDSKAIVAWNALLLKALIAADQLRQQLTNDKYPYLAQADRFRDQLASRLSKLYQSPQIPRAIAWQAKQPKRLGQATLEDLAYATQAFAHLNTAQQATSQTNPLLTTWQSTYQTLIAKQNQFLTLQGWKFTPNSTDTSWRIADNELPSPTAILNCYLPASRKLQTLPAGKKPWQMASQLQACNR